jgi:hypothetical protein
MKGVFCFPKKENRMDTKQVIQSQYLAALEMLKQAIERCPEALWDVAEEKNKFWLVVYHTLFYVDLYLQKKLEDFKPWSKHQDGAQRPGAAPEKPFAVYTRAELLEYLEICRAHIAEQTASLDLEAPSGFDWLPFGKLELQFYSIRHIQQHVGELYERLGTRAGLDLDWIGRAS